jgi:hypothetical protein
VLVAAAAVMDFRRLLYPASPVHALIRKEQILYTRLAYAEVKVPARWYC